MVESQKDSNPLEKNNKGGVLPYLNMAQRKLYVFDFSRARDLPFVPENNLQREYSIRDLIKFKKLGNEFVVDSIDPRLKAETYLLSGIPALKEIFGQYVNMDKSRIRYITELPMRGAGETLLDITVISESTIKKYGMDIREIKANEASSVAWFAMLRNLALSYELDLKSLIKGNNFSTFNTGIPNFKINSNTMVDEFISDAVSIQVGPKNVFGTLSYISDQSQLPQYEFSTRFMNQQFRALLNKKNISTQKQEAFYKVMREDEHFDAINELNKLGISVEDLRPIQISYKEMAKKLVQHIIVDSQKNRTK